MTNADRQRLILDAFAAAERTHPGFPLRDLLEIVVGRLATQHGLCVTHDEVTRALSNAAFSL